MEPIQKPTSRKTLLILLLILIIAGAAAWKYLPGISLKSQVAPAAENNLSIVIPGAEMTGIQIDSGSSITPSDPHQATVPIAGDLLVGSISVRLPTDLNAPLGSIAMAVVNNQIALAADAFSIAIATCGDGLRHQTLEACDDGNLVNGDGCSATCTVELRCGDGQQNQAPEECDDGNQVDTDACTNTCKKSICGDGLKSTPNFAGVNEACDNGAQNSDTAADACRISCIPAACGDLVVDTGEECDKGPNGDETCTNACKIIHPAAPAGPVCGNTIVEPGEACDDGNLDSTDECNACQKTMCGDTIIQPLNGNKENETCDLGPQNGQDSVACITKCQVPLCGDSITQPWIGEQCDDGNPLNEDSCTASCKTNICGDGFKMPAEACDDGNLSDGDGCTVLCGIEPSAEMTTADVQPSSLETNAIGTFDISFQINHRDVQDNAIIEVIFPAGFILNPAGQTPTFGATVADFQGGLLPNLAEVKVEGQKVIITGKGSGAVMGIPRNKVLTFKLSNIKNPAIEGPGGFYGIRIVNPDNTLITETLNILGDTFSAPVAATPPAVEPPVPPPAPPPVTPPTGDPPVVPAPIPSPPTPPAPPVAPLPPSPVVRPRIPRITIQGPTNPRRGEVTRYTYTIEWIEQP